MNVGKALYNILSNDAEIVAICGTRVYPEIADQDAALPFIVYKVSDIQPSGTKSGSSSLDTARVDVYCVSEEYGEAMTISDEVRSALDRVGGTYTGVNIQSIDFDTADVEFDSDQRAYIAEATYNVRVLRVGQAPDINIQPLSILTVEEVDGDPSGLVNKLVVSNGSLSIAGSTATITTGAAAGVSYHGRYDTEAETERSGATATLEVYYTARADGDGFAESEVSDTGVTDTINRTLSFAAKFQANPDTAADWTDYTTQPADNATFATAKAALLAGLNETDATANTRGTLPLSLKMVRTTTAPPPPSEDLILDTYTGAAAAYSVRRLNSQYTGACLQVKRSSDLTTQDIGFDSNGYVDTAAISSFCGTSDGTVTIWYDQSQSGGTGVGNDLTQTTNTAQPKIIENSVLKEINGKLALQKSGVYTGMDLGTAITGSDVDVYSVSQAVAGLSVSLSIFSNKVLFIAQNNTDPHTANLGTPTNFVDGSSFTGTTRANLLTAMGSNQTLLTSLGLDFSSGSYFSTGWPAVNIASHDIQELLIWTSNHPSRTGVEGNIDTFYQIPGMP